MTDRNNKGQFAKGSKGGPGRPTRKVEVARELAYLGVILDKVTTEDWGEVIDKAIEQAKGGDARAREWLAGHLVANSLEEVLLWKEQASFFAVPLLTPEMADSGLDGDE